MCLSSADCSVSTTVHTNSSHHGQHCTRAAPATRTCLGSFLPQALCICSPIARNYLIIPGNIHTAHSLILLRFQFKYHLSREAFCPPNLQQHCHSTIGALLSTPHFMSSTGEDRFSGAGLTLQLSLDVPLANTNRFAGHQPQTRPLATVRKCDPQIRPYSGAYAQTESTADQQDPNSPPSQLKWMTPASLLIPALASLFFCLFTFLGHPTQHVGS